MYYLRDLQVQNRINRLVKTTKQTGITIIRISTALFYYNILCLYYTNRMVFIEPNESKNIIELYTKNNYEDSYLQYDTSTIKSKHMDHIHPEKILSIKNNSNFYVTLYNGTQTQPFGGTFINLKHSVSDISNYTDNITFSGIKIQLLTSFNVTFHKKMHINFLGIVTVVPEKDQNIKKTQEELAKYQTYKDILADKIQYNETEKDLYEMSTFEENISDLRQRLSELKKNEEDIDVKNTKKLNEQELIIHAMDTESSQTTHNEQELPIIDALNTETILNEQDNNEKVPLIELPQTILNEKGNNVKFQQENSDTTFTYTLLFFISVVSVLVFIYMIYRWRTVLH